MYFQFKGKAYFDKAFYWLNKASNQKHPYAQYNLGVMYQNGDFVKQDYEKSVRIIQTSRRKRRIRCDV